MIRRLLPKGDHAIETLWWINPVYLFAVINFGIIIWAVSLSRESYALWRVPKVVGPFDVGLVALASLSFALGAYVARRFHSETKCNYYAAEPMLERFFWMTAILAVVGYVLYLGVAVKNGFSLATIHEFFFGSKKGIYDDIKGDIFKTIPGVTTATQFGLSACVLGTAPHLFRRLEVKLALALLLCFAFFRALILSERLALVELLVPIFAVWLRFHFLEIKTTRWMKTLLQAVPVVACAGLFVFFGVFEYFRSYRYYQDKFNNVAEFTMWRLGAYYTTAYNNGSLLYRELGVRPLPYQTLHSFWEFPLVENSPMSYESLTNVNPFEEYMETLRQRSNEEYNNCAGLYDPLLDYGLTGFPIYWFVFGGLVYLLYRSYLRGRTVGVLLYPVAFLCMLETPRYMYLNVARSFAPLAMLTLAICLQRFRIWENVSSREAETRDVPQESPLDEALSQ